MSHRTVLVHSGITDPGMWDGFELPGELVRHHLAGDLDAVTDLNLSYWAPDLADRLRPMARRSVEFDVPEIAAVDLSAVRLPALVLVGELDKPDFHAIADRLVCELPDVEHAVIPGAGHLPSLERPEATAELVRGFLERKTTI